MNPQPTQSFVPLTAAPASLVAREFRVAVVNSNGNGNGNGNSNSKGNGTANSNGNGSTNGNGTEKRNSFQTLEQPRSIPFHGAEKKPCEPRVSVQRDGDRVTHLRIQCTCGQIIDLACVYDPPAQGVS